MAAGLERVAANGHIFSATIVRMQHPVFPLSIIMRRVPVANRWISEKWDVAAVAPDARHDAIDCTVQGVDSWLWRGFALDLHPSEAEGYYLNLSAPDPRVFVMWRLEPWEAVETAPPWVTDNYRPEPRRKQRRNESFWREGEGGESSPERTRNR